MSWGRLFQMWGTKCEKMRKPWPGFAVEAGLVSMF